MHKCNVKQMPLRPKTDTVPEILEQIAAKQAEINAHQLAHSHKPQSEVEGAIEDAYAALVSELTELEDSLAKTASRDMVELLAKAGHFQNSPSGSDDGFESIVEDLFRLAEASQAQDRAAETVPALLARMQATLAEVEAARGDNAKSDALIEEHNDLEQQMYETRSLNVADIRAKVNHFLAHHPEGSTDGEIELVIGDMLEFIDGKPIDIIEQSPTVPALLAKVQAKAKVCDELTFRDDTLTEALEEVRAMTKAAERELSALEKQLFATPSRDLKDVAIKAAFIGERDRDDWHEKITEELLRLVAKGDTAQGEESQAA